MAVARAAVALTMSGLGTLGTLGTLGLLATAPAHAQLSAALYGGARDGSGFESSGANAGEPLRLRSSAAAALALEAPYDGTRLWQLFASRQSTRLVLGAAAAPGAPAELPLQVTYLHLGGVNYFEGMPARGGGSGPFVAGGLGLTHLAPNLPGTASRTRASMNLGIGYEWAPAKALALRLELRGYATLIRSQGGFFCSGGCTVFVQGDALTQAELLLGLRLATF